VSYKVNPKSTSSIHSVALTLTYYIDRNLGKSWHVPTRWESTHNFATRSFLTLTWNLLFVDGYSLNRMLCITEIRHLLFPPDFQFKVFRVDLDHLEDKNMEQFLRFSDSSTLDDDCSTFKKSTLTMLPLNVTNANEWMWKTKIVYFLECWHEFCSMIVKL